MALQLLSTNMEKKDFKAALENAKFLKLGAGLQAEIIRMVRLLEIVCFLELNEFATAKLHYEELQKIPESKPAETDPPELHDIYTQSVAIEGRIKASFEAQSQKANQGRSGLETEFKAAGEDKDLLFQVALKSTEQEVYDIALDSLYAIVRREKGWNEKAAFKKYIELLSNPKVDKQLVKTHRLKLSNLVA